VDVQKGEEAQQQNNPKRERSPQRRGTGAGGDETAVSTRRPRQSGLAEPFLRDFFDTAVPRMFSDPFRMLDWDPFSRRGRGRGTDLATAALAPAMLLADIEIPSVDVYESDDGKSIIVQAELPGMNKDDIKVRVEGNELVIQGEHREEKNEQDKDKRFFRRERRIGKFERRLLLDEDIDPDKLDAKYENGVLRIVVPKSEESAARRK
jgi:HSP20 family molecular chaperone IbpA